MKRLLSAQSVMRGTTPISMERASANHVKKATNVRQVWHLAFVPMESILQLSPHRASSVRGEIAVGEGRKWNVKQAILLDLSLVNVTPAPSGLIVPEVPIRKRNVQLAVTVKIQRSKCYV